MTENAKKIKELIDNNNSHFSADEIYLELRKSGYKISGATVYNSLNTLVQNGEIKRISFEGQPDKYDKLIRHDHLVCSVCGEISDIDIGDLTNIIKQKYNGGFSSYDLKINYVCDKCKKK